ncbi:hypothetical protein C475_01961 [Halosimplex carlsbadense 2-9-1]|uniref:Lipoprotein n=1 Tax=Halosimplex carlsbadense 2-9-1 TaxID=797114 RepID=M0D2J7_9EURY|nr:hypothetical protein [Halosimplex carlsbadense]ELZ29675.1 hypothetical protein C475_01961 [Halosimplex carlsbadense 2-9-1]
MKRVVACVLVVALTATAGCNGIQGVFESDQSTATEAPPSATVAEGGPNSGNGPTGGDGPTAGGTDAGPESGLYTVEETDTGEIAIRLSDLSMDYNFTGGSTQIASGDDTALRTQQIRKQNRRTFVLENRSRVGEQPVALVSVAIIYESSSAAESALQDHLGSFDGANTSRVDVAGFEGWQTTFTTEDDLRNVAVFGQDENLVYYTVTAGTSRRHPGFTQELFAEMAVDVRSGE